MPSEALVSHCCDNFQLKIGLGRECWEHKRCPVVVAVVAAAWVPREDRPGWWRRCPMSTLPLTRLPRGPKLINTQHVTHACAGTRAHTHTHTHTHTHVKQKQTRVESPQVKK